jgi:hypothetical protein
VSVLIKLVSLEYGVMAQDLEWRIANGDEGALKLIRDTAEQDYPNLAVFEDVDDLDSMHRALDEVESYWDDPTELIIFDFVDLLTYGDAAAEGATRQKIKAIKAFGRKRAPLMALHQTSRTAGADGAEQTISSGSFGGESEATYLVGVRRKRDYWGAAIRELEEKRRRSTSWGKKDDEKLDEARWQLRQHLDTVTFTLLKNKRPPCTLVSEADFQLDANTGRISTLDRAFTDSSTLGAAQKALLHQEGMF